MNAAKIDISLGIFQNFFKTYGHIQRNVRKASLKFTQNNCCSINVSKLKKIFLKIPLPEFSFKYFQFS